MAKVDVTVGGAWTDDDEGVIVTWLFNDGATVKEGEVIVEVMLEKAQMEVEAPASGKLSVLLETDDVISNDTVIGTIESE